MRFAIENRRWVMLAGGVLAFVLGMPEILRAQEATLGTAAATSSAQVANGDEQTGSSEDQGSTEENGWRRRCRYYYYPCYHYYYRPVYYYPVVRYPVVTYPVVAYPVATYPTVTIPTYGPYGVFFNGKSGSGDADNSLAARQKFTDQIGIITAAFYTPASMSRGALGTGLGKERGEEFLAAHELVPGKLLTVVHIRYVDAATLAQAH